MLKPYYQVVIQAGHKGGRRNSGSTGTKASSGTKGEAERTTKLVNQVYDRLDKLGINVRSEDALFDKKYSCGLMVAVHFDGSRKPCSSGASVGYPVGRPAGSNKPTADRWKELYSEFWPYKWMKDNFTSNLKYYYGFSWANTKKAELIVEMGELTCDYQKRWLDENLESGLLADLLTYFIVNEIGTDKQISQVSKPKKEKVSRGTYEMTQKSNGEIVITLEK